MQNDQLVFPLREHSQDLLQLPCSSPKKWREMAKGRFSSAAEKGAKNEKLESPRNWRRGLLGGEQREVQAVPGPAQQWGAWMEEGVQHRLLAELAMGKNPHLKKKQTGAITTWANYNPGKANSKVLHPNPAGKKDGMGCWDGQRKQYRWQSRERKRWLEKLLFCCASRRQRDAKTCRFRS